MHSKKLEEIEGRRQADQEKHESKLQENLQEIEKRSQNYVKKEIRN